MRERVLEESVLFISVTKWFLLASTVGVLVGCSTSIFLWILEWAIEFAGRSPFFFLLLPLAILLSSLLVRLAPEAAGHGTEKVIEAVHLRSGKINPFVVPIKLAATIVTIAVGGSAGKEGPCAQIGAGLSSLLSDVFRFNEQDRKKLVICGISAGFSTVFGTPMAGAIFGVEVLYMGELVYTVLFPSFVSGIVGYQVANALGVHYFHDYVGIVPSFSGLFFVQVCLGGIFFGLCAFLFIEILRYFEQLRVRSGLSWISVCLVGGSALIVLGLVFGREYLGLGLETMDRALEGKKIFPLAAFIKMITTSITLAFGGSGGIVTPIFFVGATAGSLFGQLFGLDRSAFASIGMVSLLAGAANTPISASIMAVELFGPSLAPYAALACIISFLMVGHRSVYPSQVLAVAKSSTLFVEKGTKMEDVHGVLISPHPRSVTGIIMKVTERARKIARRGRGV